MSNTLAALLDRLDEAKRLHEVERDRANDLLVERDVAERECASLRGVVDRLRTSMLHISGIPEVSINCGIGDGSTPAAVEALAGMFRTAERERDEARDAFGKQGAEWARKCDEVEQLTTQRDEARAERDNHVSGWEKVVAGLADLDVAPLPHEDPKDPGWIVRALRWTRISAEYYKGEVARRVAVLDGIADAWRRHRTAEFPGTYVQAFEKSLVEADEARAEVDRVQRECSEFSASNADLVRQLAELEEAIRREWANHREANPFERTECMDRLLDLVEPDDADPEDYSDQPTPDVGCLQAHIDHLRQRLARLEARNA